MIHSSWILRLLIDDFHFYLCDMKAMIFSGCKLIKFEDDRETIFQEVEIYQELELET